MEGHHSALTAALKRLPKGISQRFLTLASGQTEIDLTWSSGATNFLISVKVSTDEKVFEANSTSTHMSLPAADVDTRFIECMGLMQEVLPFGSIQFDFGTKQAKFRTSQLLKGIIDSEDLQAYHVNVHLNLLPIVSKSFEEMRADISSSDLVIQELKKRIKDARLEL